MVLINRLMPLTCPGRMVWLYLRFLSWSIPAVFPACLLSVDPATPTDLQIESPPGKPDDQPPTPPGLPVLPPRQVKLLPAAAAGKTEEGIKERVNA